VDTIENKERMLINQLLHNQQLFEKALVYLDETYFDATINKQIIKIIRKYYQKYKKIPEPDLVFFELNYDKIDENWFKIDNIWSYEYLEEYLNEYIKNMSMKLAIEDSIEDLEKADFGSIEKRIKKALEIDLNSEIGLTIDVENFNEIYNILTSKEQLLSTGWANVDKHLGGGVNKPSLNYLLASSGGGKSVGLINLSWNYVQMNEDVLYISLELKEEKILKRYFTHAAKIKYYEFKDKEIELLKFVKKHKKLGRFTVQFHQPNSLNSMKLELIIRQYIQKYDKKPVVIVDYAGLMIPNSKKWEGLFEKDKYISEELRGVALLYDIVIWSADQYNRCIYVNEKVINDKNEQISIKDIKIGDKILGKNGYVIVKAKTKPKKQRTFKITLEDGRSIIVSENHMFPKDVNGKIIMDNVANTLKKGDYLYVN